VWSLRSNLRAGRFHSPHVCVSGPVLTNAASLWYVALDETTVGRPYSFPIPSDAHAGFVAVDVPPLVPHTPAQTTEFEEGRQLYEAVGCFVNRSLRFLPLPCVTSGLCFWFPAEEETA
jgi:hypothetical protein